MGFSPSSIPNSSGAGIVINLLTSPYTSFLKSRPLGSQSVTSLIQFKPHNVSPFPSNAVIMGVGLAAAATVYVLWKKFASPPASLPDLSSKATASPASTSGSTSAVPPPDLSPAGPPPVTPGPLPSIASPPDASSPTAPPPLPSAPLPPATPSNDGSRPPISPRPPPVAPLPAPESRPVDGAGLPSVPPPSPLPAPAAPIEPAAAASPQPVVELIRTSSDAGRPSPPPSFPSSPMLASSPVEVPRNASPPSPENHSPPSGRSSPPSPPRPATLMQRIVGAMGILGNTVSYCIYGDRHHTKYMKYRLTQEQLEQFARSENIQHYTPGKNDSKIVCDIATAWNELYTALLFPRNFATADDQYRATVLSLRKTAQMLLSVKGEAEAEVKQKLSAQLQFVRRLSYVRFAGIQLFSYCRDLIELATGQALPENLTLDAFLTVLKDHTIILNNPEKAHAMNEIACKVKMGEGTIGVNFDPGMKSNIPYRYGTFGINGRSIHILRHGTPVTQNDLFGFLYRVAADFGCWLVPSLNRFLPSKNPLSKQPIITADFIACVEAAEEREENILSVILENGLPQVADESGRVRARLSLGIHKNFFPVVFSLDNDFFKSPRLGESIEELKKRLAEQLLMPLKQREANRPLTDSVFLATQIDDQLQQTGFCIPPKVRDASGLPREMDRLLAEVQGIYFPDVRNITTVEQHQAFIIQSYVHIILFLCWRLDIRILEALCKDDKDRGNVIKTLLMLHFLYLSNQLTPEKLTSVLVNTLAAPFIIQKRAIIKSRLTLLEHIIPFISDAYNRVRLPQTFIFEGRIQDAFFDVAAPPGQSIYPDNSIAKNLEEYRAFLDSPRPVRIPEFTGNLIDEMAQEFEQAGKLQEDRIEQRIVNDAQEMNIRRGVLPVTDAFKDVRAFLGVRAEIKSLEETLKATCAAQCRTCTRLHMHLKQIFDNRLLGYSVELDKDAMRAIPESGLDITDNNGCANFTFTMFYKIVNDKGQTIARLKGILAIQDHRTGKAQFEYSFI